MSCDNYPSKKDVEDFALNAKVINEFTTSDLALTPSAASDGKNKITLAEIWRQANEKSVTEEFMYNHTWHEWSEGSASISGAVYRYTWASGHSIFLKAGSSVVMGATPDFDVFALTHAVIDIKDFGAVGDGVSLDGASVQMAFDAAEGGAILITSGYFYINVDITIRSNTRVIGAGGVFKYGAAQKVLKVRDAENVIVDGVVIDGNYKDWASANQFMLSVKNSTNVTIQDCHVFNGLNAGICVGTLGSGETNENIRILNNYVHHIGDPVDRGFYAYGNGISVVGGKSVQIHGNTIHDIHGVGGINLEGLLQDDISIKNNTIHRTTGSAAGIKLHAGGIDDVPSRVDIEGNDIYEIGIDGGATEGAIRIQSSDHVRIINNNIHDCEQGGSIRVYSGVEALVSGNYIKNCLSGNYYINTARNVTFINNTIECTTGSEGIPIALESLVNDLASFVATGNTVINSPEAAAILMARSPITFTDNIIINCGSADEYKGSGIAVGVGLKNCIVGNNTIKDSLGNLATRFPSGFYNFSGIGCQDMRYIPDRWVLSETGTLKKYDIYGNNRYMESDAAVLASAPTGGYNERGRKVWNRNAATGQPIGWVCVESGEPGVWSSMGNVA